MTDTLLTVQKLTAVPSTPTTPNTVFLVALPDKPDYLELYVSSRDGTSLKRHINEADIKALIAQAGVAGNSYVVVDDISARNELQHKGSVYVKDASGDETVNSGGAFYLWDDSSSNWVKISEAESLDVALDWDSIADKPTSSPTLIDAAVSKAHSHANTTQLDKIGEQDGKLTYDGKFVATTINDAW